MELGRHSSASEIFAGDRDDVVVGVEDAVGDTARRFRLGSVLEREGRKIR
jgi:hypothetical protein